MIPKRVFFEKHLHLYVTLKFLDFKKFTQSFADCIPMQAKSAKGCVEFVKSKWIYQVMFGIPTSNIDTLDIYKCSTELD